MCSKNFSHGIGFDSAVVAAVGGGPSKKPHSDHFSFSPQNQLFGSLWHPDHGTKEGFFLLPMVVPFWLSKVPEILAIFLREINLGSKS